MEKKQKTITMPNDGESREIVKGLCEKLPEVPIKEWGFKPGRLIRDYEVSQRILESNSSLKSRGIFKTEESQDFEPYPPLNLGELFTNDKSGRYCVFKNYLGNDSWRENECPVFGDGGWTVFEHYYSYGLRVELEREAPLEFSRDYPAVKKLYEQTRRKFATHSRKQKAQERKRKFDNAKKKVKSLLRKQ